MSARHFEFDSFILVSSLAIGLVGSSCGPAGHLQSAATSLPVTSRELALADPPHPPLIDDEIPRVSVELATCQIARGKMFVTQMSQIQRGWTRQMVLDHAGHPRKSTPTLWTYFCADWGDGVLAAVQVRFNGDVVRQLQIPIGDDALRAIEVDELESQTTQR